MVKDEGVKDGEPRAFLSFTLHLLPIKNSMEITKSFEPQRFPLCPGFTICALRIAFFAQYRKLNSTLRLNTLPLITQYESAR